MRKVPSVLERWVPGALDPEDEIAEVGLRGEDLAEVDGVLLHDLVEALRVEVGDGALVGRVGCEDTSATGLFVGLELDVAIGCLEADGEGAFDDEVVAVAACLVRMLVDVGVHDPELLGGVAFPDLAFECAEAGEAEGVSEEVDVEDEGGASPGVAVHGDGLRERGLTGAGLADECEHAGCHRGSCGCREVTILPLAGTGPDGFDGGEHGLAGGSRGSGGSDRGTLTGGGGWG